MSTVFIEANATGTTVDAMRLVRSRGHEYVFVTMDRGFYATLADNPLDVAAAVIDCDTYNVPEVLRAIRHIDADAIIAFDDYHLPVAAMCAMALGLEHADITGLVRTRYKDVARELTAGLPGAVWSMVIDEDARHEADLETLAYPVVVKPLDESGSVSVRLCHDAADIAVVFEDYARHVVNVRRYRPLRALLIEEYLAGEEYSCELYWDESTDGWAVAGITKKLLGREPYFVECGHVFPAPLPGALRARVEEQVLGWLKAVGLRCGGAHVELRIRDGVAYLIEINPRPPGGHIAQLVQWCTGIDLLSCYVGFHLSSDTEQATAQPEFEAAASRFLRTDEIASEQAASRLRQHFAGMKTFQRGKIQRSNGDGARPAQSNYDRSGYALLAAADAGVVEDDLDGLNAALVTTCEASP